MFARFRAAVTGAGAVEHVANWGNDDTTYDDAYFLGGLPWDMMKNYNDEAAIWQVNKVKTPTHIVAGAEDIRVDHAHLIGQSHPLRRADRLVLSALCRGRRKPRDRAHPDDEGEEQ